MSSPVAFLTDFSDRISPMLVKELRQGLRAKTFTVVFLALQVFLAVMLFSAGAASSSDNVGTTISGIIFMFFSVAVLMIQPLRGISALTAEVKGNTIDMMVLTSLSAWRIVFGKWIAIVSQSALLLATIIPYLILRYFFGGMNLFGEMILLVLIFLTSMALTALTVGLSGCHSIIVRMIIPVVGLPVVLWSTAMLIFEGGGGSSNIMDLTSMNTPASRIGVLVYVACLLYVSWSLLSLGASLIAPAAENHSLWRRILAMVLMLLIAPIILFFEIRGEWSVVLFTSVIGIPAIIISLTDSSHLISSVHQSFTKRGRIASAVAWLLLPTWHSGILYAITLGCTALAIYVGFNFLPISGMSWDDDSVVAILALFGGLFFPAVWQLFLFKGDGQRVAHYLLLLAGSSIMLGVLTTLAESMDTSGFLWAFAWHPFAFLAMLSQNDVDDSVALTSVIIVNLVLLFLLSVAAISGVRKSIDSLDKSELEPSAGE